MRATRECKGEFAKKGRLGKDLSMKKPQKKGQRLSSRTPESIEGKKKKTRNARPNRGQKVRKKKKQIVSREEGSEVLEKKRNVGYILGGNEQTT